MNLVVIAILALAVIYLDGRLTKTNMGVPFNGIGAIPSVLLGQSRAPMQYRVLVPWVCAFLGHPRLFGAGNGRWPFFAIYLGLRWFAIAFAMVTAYVYFSLVTTNPLVGALMLAVYFAVAALYDYTDGYLEIAFFALSFSLLNTGAAIYLLPVIVLIAALNRETAIFIPVAVLLSGELAIGMASLATFAAGWYLPRRYYPKRKRYCEFFTLWRNIKTLKKEVGSVPLPYSEYMIFGVLAMVAVVVYMKALFTVGLSGVEISLGLMFGALLVPTMWREIRVFGPVMLAVIPMVVR